MRDNARALHISPNQEYLDAVIRYMTTFLSVDYSAGTGKV